MDAQAGSELEREIRARCERGDLPGAAEVALRGYGPEIFGFLVTFHRSEQDAAEVFSIFTERVWRGLDRFGWHCSFRTWAYTVARNASQTYRIEAHRRAQREAPLPDGSGLQEIAAQIRTETLSYLRTRTKTRAAQIRETLPQEDQVLLTLRVDKDLSWDDLARVLHGEEGGPLAGDALRRESARLRKRFQLVKQRLVELARREGLIDDRPKR
jgi:RNA polymerase sigma-70 factor (ECF subfamily)